MEVSKTKLFEGCFLPASAGIPATIGILDGVACVGMTSNELEELTSSVSQKEVLKISRRDLSFACGSVRPRPQVPCSWVA